ncbi:MAG TPA: hypothetical protein V6D08_07025 [Candidatus Obscuribacterales bacterium]
MATLSTGVLGVFAAAALIAFLTPFLTEKVGSRLSWQLQWLDVKRYALVLLPFVLLFGAGQYFGFEAANSLRFFALGAALPFVLARLGFPDRLLGILLLLLSVLLTATVDVGGMPLPALMAGLVVWKLTDSLWLKHDSTLEDVLPALLWLGGIYWINNASPSEQIVPRQGLLLGALSVCLLMRAVQGPFLTDDRLYVKRIALATTGGLLLLIYITKVMVLVGMDSLAVLVGAGIFLMYLFEAIEGNKDARLSAPEAVKSLVLIGIFTVLASRLLGTFGWIILAPAVLVATRPGAAMFAGLFWIVRAMLQTYIYQFNPNVTGVNIMHPYVGAALYAGLGGVLIMSVFLREERGRSLTVAIALAGATLLPASSNYFLHAEPTCSLLASSVVAAVLMSVLGPVMYRKERAQHDALLLLPALMIAVATLTNQLIPLGNEATTGDRLKLLAYAAGALVIVSLITWWISSASRRKPVEVS